MILSDRDLRNALGSLALETDEPNRPFEARQIQPCSIDLRLDRHFWVLRRPLPRRSLDFRNNAWIGEVDMGRLFRPRSLQLGEGIRIRPGEMLLGRTFEKFTIPNGFAGKLEGRSTFARLGLSIHCTGDFINPGWRGRMPLQLVNHGRLPIVVTPYLEICQLLVIRTTTESDQQYGGDGTHKYMNDAGGPSRYWLDESLAKLQSDCGSANVPEIVTRHFIEATGGGADPAMLDRFSGFVRSLPHSELISARHVLERFAARDTRRHTWAKGRLSFVRWFGVLPAGTSLGLLFKTPYGAGHYVFWGATIVLVLVGLWAITFAKEPDQPFTLKQIEEHFSKLP